MCNDTHLFIEILKSFQGVQFIREETQEGVSVSIFEGITGNLVIIDTSEDDIPTPIAKGHLDRLGLRDQIPAMFPDDN